MSEETTAAPVPALRTGGAIQPIIGQNIEELWRLAGIFQRSEMVPKAFNSQEKVMVCLMHGQEVGLSHMAALQSIAVINGRPTIWGDGALGLVQGSGKLEWIKEWYEGDPATDSHTAHCHAKRKGSVEVVKNSFSVAEAKKAKLWTKQGPWSDYPFRMLKMRARSWTLRDGFSDTLKGFGITEEVMDIPADKVEHTVVSSGPLVGTPAPVNELKMPSVKPAVDVGAEPAPEVEVTEHAPGVEYLDKVMDVTEIMHKGKPYYGIKTKAHGKKQIGTVDGDAYAIAKAAIGGDKIQIVYEQNEKGSMTLVRIGPAKEAEAA